LSSRYRRRAPPRASPNLRITAYRTPIKSRVIHEEQGISKNQNASLLLQRKIFAG
jgi:hypothetical protein